MQKTSIKFNALINGVRNVLNLLFPLITFPYISRTLSVSGIGKYNFSNSIISYFLLLAALGIDKYSVREGAKYRDDREKMSQFASKVFTLNLLSTVVSYLILFVLMFFSTKLKSYNLCILIFSLEIIFTTIGVEWIYTIYEQYTYITIRSIIFKTLSIILLFIFVRGKNDYLNYAIITVFATVGSNLLNFLHLRKYCDLKISLSTVDFKKMIKPILVIFGANVAIQIYVNADTTMLGYIKNDYIVGIYSVSTKIYTIIKTLLASILIVTIPRLAMYLGKKMLDEYNKLLFDLINTLLLIVIPSVVGLFIVSKSVVIIISGSHFIRATKSLQILCIAITLSIISGVLNQCVLIPYKREKYILVSSIASAAVNVLLNFWFIPVFSESGAALTTVIAELLSLVINYYYCRDIINNVMIKKATFLNILSIIIGSFIILISCVIIDKFVSILLIKLVLQIIVSVLLYLLILLLFKNPFLFSVLKRK